MGICQYNAIIFFSFVTIISGALAYQPPCNKRNAKWEERFNELKQYKVLYGDTNVSQTYAKNPSLGRWVRRQRVEYGNLVSLGDEFKESDIFDNLTRYRIHKLKTVGFVFDRKTDIWNRRLQELKDFRHQYGHTRVPQHNAEGDRWYKLGLWVRNQRSMYNRLMNAKLEGDSSDSQQGKEGITYNFLTEERIRLLEDVGFCWDVQEENWMEHYQKLLHYKNERGNVDVPSRYDRDPALARWVQQQRRNKSSLTTERLKRLEEVGFVFGRKQDLQWWANYQAICEYKKKNGDFSVPSSDYKLYNWVHNTKRRCREYATSVKKEQILNGDCYSLVSGLNQERIEALRQIDFYLLPITVDEIGTIAPRLPKKRRAVSKDSVIRQRPKTVLPRSPPKPQKKEFIPFPWDEI